MATHVPVTAETGASVEPLRSNGAAGAAVVASDCGGSPVLDGLEEGGTGFEVEEINAPVGTETSAVEERITVPFDPMQIRIDTRTLTIDLLLTRIRAREINLTPDFQRKGGLWRDAAQSRLIESILLRIPLPTFYLDGADDGEWLVIDGLQRLTALKRFVLDQQLRLTELDYLKTCEGKTYDELPRPLQRRINETQVVVHLIAASSPPEVRFNIFKRINTGGLPLSAQEIRHALNQGPAPHLLKLLATSAAFRRATHDGIRDERMADRECVLRFLAFSITPYSEYRERGFDEFLNRAMRELNAMRDDERSRLAARFEAAMDAARQIFGDHAFRKRFPGSTRQYAINKALFETWSVALGKLSESERDHLIARKSLVDKQFLALMQDETFVGAISVGTGEIRKVQERFSRVELVIRKVLG